MRTDNWLAWAGMLLLAGLIFAVAPLAAEEAAKKMTPDPVVAAPTAQVEEQKTPPTPQTLLERMFSTFQRGGSIMWALLITSVVGLTFAMERFSGLRRKTHLPKDMLEKVSERLRKQNPEAARLLLKGDSAALAKVLDGLLMRKDANRQEMEQILEDEAGRVLWDMKLNIRPVGIVASLAPLIGLLGTVIGLIHAFQEAAEKGMDNPANFAEGIYLALYTTAFGLSIAIPFSIIYHYLRGKADIIMREVEDKSLHLIIEFQTNKIPADSGVTETVAAQ